MTKKTLTHVFRTWILLNTLISVGNAASATNQTMQSFYESEHFLNYNKYIRPVNLINETIDAEMAFILQSIQELDCVHGVLETIGHLEVTWTDRRIGWDDDKSSLTLRYDDVWVPPVVVVNLFDDFSGLASPNDVITIKRGGMMTWKPRIMIRSICKTDVTYFPFDEQFCNISFGVAGYEPNEVRISFKSGQRGINIDSLNENNEWNIQEAEIFQTLSAHKSMIHFHLKMSRKPVYFIINLFLPVFLIAVLSTCSFMLPGEENRGQFVSVAFITLSFYFILTLSLLPKTSDNFPYFGYFFMWQMIYSVLVSVTAILSVRLYFMRGNENIPRLFRLLVSHTTKNRKSKNKKLPNVMRIRVIPPDTEGHLEANQENKHKCCEQRRISTLNDRQKTKEPLNWSNNFKDTKEMQSEIPRGRNPSVSSMSSNGSKTKLCKRVSPVHSSADQRTRKEKSVQFSENDLLHSKQRKRESSGGSEDSYTSQKTDRGVCWSNDRDIIQDGAVGFTKNKQWRSSSIRSERFQSCEEHLVDVATDKCICRTENHPSVVGKVDSTKDFENGKTIKKKWVSNDKYQKKSLKKRKQAKIDDKNITWKQVSLTLDKVFMFCFLLSNVLVSTFVLLPLAIRP